MLSSFSTYGLPAAVVSFFFAIFGLFLTVICFLVILFPEEVPNLERSSGNAGKNKQDPEPGFINQKYCCQHHHGPHYYTELKSLPFFPFHLSGTGRSAGWSLSCCKGWVNF
ncbi:MAG: hypothetical protein MZU84_07130 [Sphingobacterium sp.]|nr:hypothetical protein [Sphingobacterium sp.]